MPPRSSEQVRPNLKCPACDGLALRIGSVRVIHEGERGRRLRADVDTPWMSDAACRAGPGTGFPAPGIAVDGILTSVRLDGTCDGCGAAWALEVVRCGGDSRLHVFHGEQTA